MEDVLIPIVMFVVMGVIFFLSFHYRFRSRAEVQTTIRVALEKGDSLTPALIDRLAEPKQDRSRDLRRGIILAAVGISFVLFANILGQEAAVRPLIGVSMFPLIVGLAYLALWRFARDQGS